MAGSRDKGVVVPRAIVGLLIIKQRNRSDNDIVIAFFGKLALVGCAGVGDGIHFVFCSVGWMDGFRVGFLEIVSSKIGRDLQSERGKKHSDQL